MGLQDTGADDSSTTKPARFTRRTAISGAAVGAVALAAPLWAFRSMLSGEADSAKITPKAAAGRVNVFDYLDAEQRADVQGRTRRLDVTAACQRALSAGNDVVFPAGTYLVDADPKACLKALSGQTVTFEPGSVLEARPNALEQYQVLLIENVRDVTVLGGTILGERSSHRGETGEHGMGIGIFGSQNVIIRQTTVRDCWGDGIYVGGRGFEGQSRDVRIENCVCDGNRRQGLTIAAVENCTVVGGKFVNTKGTLPASGIDIEPNRDKPGAQNIVIEGAVCSDNEGHGLTLSQVHTHQVRVTGLVANRNGMSGISAGYPGSDVIIDTAECQENGEHGIHIFGAPTYVSKHIEIRRPTCSKNGLNGILIGPNVDGFSVDEGLISLNGEHGLVCDGTGGRLCDDGALRNNRIHSNSQRSDRSFDNLLIGPQCDRIRIEDNDIEQGNQGRRPRFGLHIATDGQVIVERNDLRAAGAAKNAQGFDRSSVTARGNSGLG
jgi:hypothetical protein